MNRVDGMAILLAILLHVGVVAGLSLGRASIARPTPKAAIEVEVRPPELPVQAKAGAPGEAGAPNSAARPAPARPERTPGPRPPRPSLPRVAQATPTPAPTADPTPTPEQTTPQFQFAMESPEADEAAPGSPGAPGGSAASGKGTGGGGGGGTAVDGVALRQLPSVDTDACGRNAAYTPEAQSLGIEGDVALRVTLDSRGKVTAIKVLSGLGHGLDEVATTALKTRCLFTPAIDMSGRPVAYVIPRYLFRFRLP